MAKELKQKSSSLGAKSKNEKSLVGAPSQRSQSSRKGKKAWRKHIDIDEVEQGLEEMRTEERVTGKTLQKTKDEDLFVVDVTGDDQVRRRLPKVSFSQLTSAKILAQRSAVPAVPTRATSTPSLKRKKLSHEEKDRLLRIGKRPRKGPFNAIIDHTEPGAGSALVEVTEAVKQSGKYDVWEEEEEDVEMGEDELSRKQTIKPPPLPHPKAHITLSAVPSPHEGTSYNPPLTSHQELLRTAHEREERRVKEAEELSKTKERIVQARKIAAADIVGGVAMGMTVQEVKDESDGHATEDEEECSLPAKKVPERKTKKERRKAEKRLAEKRALAEKVTQKRFLASVHAAKSLRKSLSKDVAERERLRLERHQQETEEKLKKGLAGQRLGRHFVPEGEVDVQLGEDLSESFRAMKPEGNLFKDRFLSMQQRALIEPRVPVLPTRRKHKLKEYEKHAYKRFDREQQ